jgi:hypothetical protein
MSSWTLTEKRNLSLPTARSTLPLQWWLAGLLPLAKGVDDAVPYHIISYQKDQFITVQAALTPSPIRVAV